MQTTQKNKRAPGGGRKPLGKTEHAVSRTVTMLPAHWKIAERLGNGVASAGLRRALETAAKK